MQESNVVIRDAVKHATPDSRKVDCGVVLDFVVTRERRRA